MSFEYFIEGYNAVVSNFESLETFPKIIFLAYLLSGIIVPFYNYKVAGKFKTGQSGAGDLCISSLVSAACWRVPALLYSIVCFPFLAVPMFVSTFLDIVTRILIIKAAIKANVAYTENLNPSTLPSQSVQIQESVQETVSGTVSPVPVVETTREQKPSLEDESVPI